MAEGPARLRRVAAAALFVTAFGFSTGLSTTTGLAADEGGETSGADPAIDPAAGIMNLDHLIFVVQENRSFDHYFGTFPGANGLPTRPDGSFAVCVPDPGKGRCRRPYHDTNQFDIGGPHGLDASRISVHGGRMNGHLRAFRLKGTPCTNDPDPPFSCKAAKPGPGGTPDVMGFHTWHEIPNYWSLARRYVLQDRMFAPVDSWTLPSHLYLVSGWSATCRRPKDPMTCVSDAKDPWLWTKWYLAKGMDAPAPYAWADITWLLHRHDVSWAYYVGPHTCTVRPRCDEPYDQLTTVPAQNPLPGFRTVREHTGLRNVRDNTSFFRSARRGSLPSVAWVMPSRGRGEHPADRIATGQKWVSRVVNAAMQGPDAERTAVFLVWDDWGGFYDHVRPPRVDALGYGLRVPSIVISPYADRGLDVDHRTYSFDAFLKLIEDRFLDGARLNGWNQGWRDPRPTTREEVGILADLARVFDFSQQPIPWTHLDPSPRRR